MKEKYHQGEHGAVYHFGAYPPPPKKKKTMDNTLCAETMT